MAANGFRVRDGRLEYRIKVAKEVIPRDENAGMASEQGRYLQALDSAPRTLRQLPQPQVTNPTVTSPQVTAGSADVSIHPLGSMVSPFDSAFRNEGLKGLRQSRTLSAKGAAREVLSVRRKLFADTPSSSCEHMTDCTCTLGRELWAPCLNVGHNSHDNDGRLCGCLLHVSLPCHACPCLTMRHAPCTYSPCLTMMHDHT